MAEPGVPEGGLQPGVDLDRIVPLAPEGSSTPLFCVHAGSGSAWFYLGLARLLGADRPVYGIEAPGFDGDREPVRSVTELATEYARTLRVFRPDGDFLLLGWSLGGMIAFDLAQRLTTVGARVRRLVMVDVNVPWVGPLPPEKEIVRRFLRDILATVAAPPGTVEQILAGQPDQTSGEAVFVAAERAGLLPAELDADLLAERYPVFRAHVEAVFGFEAAEPYHGPVTHLIASESPPDIMDWSHLATDLTEHVVPGDHHSIWTGGSLPRLAELVRAALSS